MIDKVALNDVAISFGQLRDAALALNTITDGLNEAVKSIDARLKDLNLGIAAWVPITAGAGEPPARLGYAKVDGKTWGLAIGTDAHQEWLFAESPRHLRIAAVPHIPALISALLEKANQMRRELGGALEKARTFGTES